MSCISSIKSYIATREETFTTQEAAVIGDSEIMESTFDCYQFNWAEKTGNVLLFPMDWVFKTYDASGSCMIKAALITLSLFTAIIGLIGALFKKLGEMANPCSSMRSECQSIDRALEEIHIPIYSEKREDVMRAVRAFVIAREKSPKWMADTHALDRAPNFYKPTMLGLGYQDIPEDATAADLAQKEAVHAAIQVFENQIEHCEWDQDRDQTPFRDHLKTLAQGDAQILAALDSLFHAYDFPYTAEGFALIARRDELTARREELLREMEMINRPAAKV